MRILLRIKPRVYIVRKHLNFLNKKATYVTFIKNKDTCLYWKKTFKFSKQKRKLCEFYQE